MLIYFYIFVFLVVALISPLANCATTVRDKYLRNRMEIIDPEFHRKYDEETMVRFERAERYHMQAYLDFYLDGDYSEAVELWHKAVKLVPMSPKYHYWMARGYLGLKQYDFAVEALENTLWLAKKGSEEQKGAVSLFLDNFPSRGKGIGIVEYMRGQENYSKKQYAIAAEHFRAAAQASPKDVSYQFWLGRSYYMLGLKKEFKYQMDKVLKLDSNHKGARVLLGGG